MLASIFLASACNPGQNVLRHLRKLGTKTHFAKLTRVLPLKKASGCCYKGLFLLSPSPPSSVDCVELKLECITSTLHRGGRGEGRCLNLTSYCVSVPRVLARVVVFLLERLLLAFCCLFAKIHWLEKNWTLVLTLSNLISFRKYKLVVAIVWLHVFQNNIYIFNFHLREAIWARAWWRVQSNYLGMTGTVLF